MTRTTGNRVRTKSGVGAAGRLASPRRSQRHENGPPSRICSRPNALAASARQYLRKLQLGLGIWVLAVISYIITGAVLGVVVGSVLAEAYACCQGSTPILQKSST